MAYNISNAFRVIVQRICPCLSKDTEETVHFVTYKRFRDDQELKEIDDTRRTINENNATSKDRNPSEDDKCGDHQAANKITEWQAGWNVTNAIQVSNIYSLF